MWRQASDSTLTPTGLSPYRYLLIVLFYMGGDLVLDQESSCMCHDLSVDRYLHQHTACDLREYLVGILSQDMQRPLSKQMLARRFRLATKHGRRTAKTQQKLRWPMSAAVIGAGGVVWCRRQASCATMQTARGSPLISLHMEPTSY